jgi:hypothetical protein
MRASVYSAHTMSPYTYIHIYIYLLNTYVFINWFEIIIIIVFALF